MYYTPEIYWIRTSDTQGYHRGGVGITPRDLAVTGRCGNCRGWALRCWSVVAVGQCPGPPPPSGGGGRVPTATMRPVRSSDQGGCDNSGRSAEDPQESGRGVAVANSKAPTGRRLVIVESPKKARTIAGYLGPGFDVEASVGHIRDLPQPSELPAEM